MTEEECAIFRFETNLVIQCLFKVVSIATVIRPEKEICTQTCYVAYRHDDVMKWKYFRCDCAIPLTKASDTELWCFLWSAPEHAVEQTMEAPVILDRHGTHHDVTVMTSLMLPVNNGLCSLPCSSMLVYNTILSIAWQLQRLNVPLDL